MCAAGLEGSTADDVAKEVAIYRAHKASPIVIATDGQARFAAALHVISVPATHPQLAFVLTAVAGHLFGYEAALAIDAQARPLREARAAIEDEVGEHLVADGDGLLRSLQPALVASATRFFDGLRSGAYDGNLEASTAVRLASSYRYALGIAPLDAYQAELGRIGTPAVVVDDLTAALTQGIEELTRPVDAIKHQAKTVTVGISRSDETLLQPPLVQAVLAAGAARDRLSYKTLRTLADIDPAVAEVTGWIRYELDGDAEDGEVPVSVVDRGGIALDIPSRTERSGRAARHEAHRGGGAAGVRHPRPRGRPHGRDRARDEGRPGHRPHAPARPVPRAPGRARRTRRAAGLPQPLVCAAGRGARDRADLPRGPPRRGAGGRPPRGADPRAGRPLEIALNVSSSAACGGLRRAHVVLACGSSLTTCRSGVGGAAPPQGGGRRRSLCPPHPAARAAEDDT